MDLVTEVFPWEKLCTRYPEFSRDTLTLPWEERCRSHSRRSTDSGVAFALSLDSGSVLSAGSGMLLESQKLLVEVCEAEEAVYSITPASAQEAAYLAYQIGNRHLALMIRESGLFCLAEPAARLLFEQLHVSFHETSTPFTPAIKFSGHTHTP